MASKILNIEAGERITKVCLAVPKGKVCEIKNSFMFLTPDKAVVDGQVMLPDLLAEALRAELSARKMTDAKKVVFSVTSGKIATREVMLPPVKDARIASVVESNAGDYFPVDLSKYHLAYTVLERIEKGEEPGLRTQVFAVPLSLLESYFTLAEMAKLTIDHIDYAGNSQYQALRMLGGDEVTMYVNVDCSNSFVSFLKGDKLLMQRSFTFGGDGLIQAYMQSANISDENFVEALHACSAEMPDFIRSGAMTHDEAADSLQRLVNSISRSNDYYNTNHYEDPVTSVVLLGPCSNLFGLREQVNEATDLPTTCLNEIPGVKAMTNEAENASFYITPIGSNVAPLDLMPASLAGSKKSKKSAEKESAEGDTSILPGILILLLCIAAGAALCYFSFTKYNEAFEAKKKVVNEISELSYTRDVYNSYVSYDACANQLLVLGDMIDSPNDELNAFITELEQKMPSGILFLSASCTRSAVSMNVTVPDYQTAAKVISQLRTFESLGSISVSDLSEDRDETDGTYVLFSIVAGYGTNPYMNDIYPYGSAGTN